MRKVFISYYHKENQQFKDELTKRNDKEKCFIDNSVQIGEIDDTGMSTDSIYAKIRDEYLRDVSVTIVLLGLQTKHRKHVDREIASSLRETKYNPRSGLVIILLPDFVSTYGSRITQENAGERIADNIKNNYAVVLKWTEISKRTLEQAIEEAYDKKNKILPDNTAPYRVRNSN